MKTLALSTLLLCMLTQAPAQDGRYFADYRSHTAANLDTAAARYARGLDEGNEGALESILAHSARIKMYFPDKKFPALEEAVRKCAMNGPTRDVRYRAYLISTLFSSPAIFSGECRKEYRTPDELFYALSARLQESLLGTVAAER